MSEKRNREQRKEAGQAWGKNTWRRDASHLPPITSAKANMIASGMANCAGLQVGTFLLGWRAYIKPPVQPSVTP